MAHGLDDVETVVADEPTEGPACLLHGRLGPEPGHQRLLGRAGGAGARAELLDLAVVLDPGAAVERRRTVGAELVEAIASQARARGVSRLEVGLPRETFAAIASTESFYRRNGFEHLGPRMRRLLDE